MTVLIMGGFACDSWIEILSVSLVDQLIRLALEYALPLGQERLSEKNVHAAIPKGAVSDTVAVEPTFVAFL